MKKIVLIIAACIVSVSSYAQRTQIPTQTYTLDDINIRDPYILVDEKSGAYYMYRSSSVKAGDGTERGGVEVFRSLDLEHWDGPKQVFTIPDDNWITGRVWAPEVHFYRGHYYLFATINSDVEWKKRRESYPAYTMRGTQIFRSKSPEGPFLAFDDREPITPMDEMALDGTLWVENGTPYLVYCHEWVQIMDGSMKVVELERDLSGRAGEPVKLFNASVAEWAAGTPTADGERSYVTDGCFLYRTKGGKLLMIWSSFGEEGYAVGIAESVTGKVTGPWRQHREPLFSRDGGHGMLFRDFDGGLNIVMHSPNSPGGAERAIILPLEERDDMLYIKE